MHLLSPSFFDLFCTYLCLGLMNDQSCRREIFWKLVDLMVSWKALSARLSWSSLCLPVFISIGNRAPQMSHEGLRDAGKEGKRSGVMSVCMLSCCALKYHSELKDNIELCLMLSLGILF